MKKLITIILILAMALPAAAPADAYKSELGMTMNEFIMKYNSIPSALGSPYVPLKKEYNWSKMDDYNIAWFYPCSDESVKIMLLSKDEKAGKSLSAGLDMIKIYAYSDLLGLISVTKRCTGIFTPDFFGMSLAPYYITDIISYYYENGVEKSGYIAYRSIDTEEKYALSFFKYQGYYFQISLLEVVK